MKGKMKNFVMKAIAGVMAVSMFAMAGCGEARPPAVGAGAELRAAQ